jgi:protein-L-isoaspartate(D-aspartate) O-methyltransferase
MLAAAGALGDRRLEAAFAVVPREAFLGPPPWWIAHPGVNNGSPSLHARLLHALAPRAGDRVAHLGAGTGYYSAILSRLVGPAGRVTAVECDHWLAAAARANLADYPNVGVVAGDAARHPSREVDRVYVSFNAGRPAAPRLERLAPGGRLVFPLGVAPPPAGRRRGGPRYATQGGAFLVERAGTAPSGAFAAAWLGPAYFVHAEGVLAADGPEAEALARAFGRDGPEFVRSLRWGAEACAAVPPERCWFWSAGWCLAYDPAA